MKLVLVIINILLQTFLWELRREQERLSAIEWWNLIFSILVLLFLR